MTEKFITIRVDEKLHKRFKIICDEFALKMGKQTELLIKSFVEAQEINVKLMKEAK